MNPPKVIVITTILLGVVFLSPMYWSERPQENHKSKVIEMVDGQQHIGHGKIYVSLWPDTEVDRGYLDGRTCRSLPSIWQHDGPYIVQKEKVDTMLYLYFPGGTGLEARIRRPGSVIRIEDD